jgi:hypothetical protein
MDVIKKTMKVEKGGVINFSLNTDLPEGEVDIVLIVNEHPKKVFNVSKYYGTLKSFQEDPIAYQKKQRNDWD